MQWLIPPLLALSDVEIEHPLAVPPVQPEHHSEQKDEQKNEQEGKDQPILDGSLERWNANLFLIPEAEVLKVFMLSWHLVQGLADALRSRS